MSTLEATIPVDAPATVSPVELAQLMAAFNQVTGRLQSTHESLRTEVARLQAELREANEQLQRSKRLAALGEMAAGIAHEVRNPLGSIRLYARMLEQDLTDRPSERQIASKIAAAVHGLDGVVGDVLSFSRELRVSPEQVEVGEVLDRALEACWTAEIPGTGVRVVQRDKRRGGGIARGVRARLWCDAALMHQALVNIIRNALQAMAEAPAPAGGHVLTLDAGPVRGDAGRPMFGVAVTDTGLGIADQTIDRMFNPFFTTRATGTGLGLAIVHRIVDAHGGRVLVRSRTSGEERGTTFQIVLPALAGASDQPRKVGPAAARTQTGQETRP